MYSLSGAWRCAGVGHGRLGPVGHGPSCQSGKWESGALTPAGGALPFLHEWPAFSPAGSWTRQHRCPSPKLCSELLGLNEILRMLQSMELPPRPPPPPWPSFAWVPGPSGKGCRWQQAPGKPLLNSRASNSCLRACTPQPVGFPRLLGVTGTSGDDCRPGMMLTLPSITCRG